MVYKVSAIPNYQFRNEKPAPGCGHTSGIFTGDTMLFTGDCRLIISGRIKGWCNRGDCEQRFYVFPKTGRVTRRNSGESLRERRARLGHY